MAKYNGHKNWNHWNVSLWINNDEGLYNIAREFVRQKSSTTGVNKQSSAEEMLRYLHDSGVTKTIDGAPYSVSAIKAAMAGMEA